jgi:ribosomal protein S18 acetylase RimI-like enzyme
MSEWVVDELQDEDFDRWRVLYQGYADFYRVPQPEENALRVWGWLRDPNHGCRGLVVRDGSGQAVGLAHYRAFARPLRASTGCFLDDLFVKPEFRGSGAVDALLDALRAVARDEGWDTVRWITADDNYRARAKYDRVSTRTTWITYDMAPAGS